MEPTAILTTTMDISNTVLYTLPTTGDAVILVRSITHGELFIAVGVWALATAKVFELIRSVVRGE